MPYKEKPITKRYLTIGELADEMNIATSRIRFWDKEFDLIKRRTKKGDRRITQREADKIRHVKYLIDEVGFTNRGVKMQLRK